MSAVHQDAIKKGQAAKAKHLDRQPRIPRAPSVQPAAVSKATVKSHDDDVIVVSDEDEDEDEDNLERARWVAQLDEDDSCHDDEKWVEMGLDCIFRPLDPSSSSSETSSDDTDYESIKDRERKERKKAAKAKRGAYCPETSSVSESSDSKDSGESPKKRAKAKKAKRVAQGQSSRPWPWNQRSFSTSRRPQ